MMEPFRCVEDKTVRTAFNKKQFSEKDFDLRKGEYYPKREKNKDYQRVFFDALIPWYSIISNHTIVALRKRNP